MPRWPSSIESARGVVVSRSSNRVPQGVCLVRARVTGALALVLAAGGLLVAPTGGLSVECSDEMVVGGDDAHDDFGCVVDVTSDGRVWVVWTAYDPAELDEEIVYSVYDDGCWSLAARVHPDNSTDDRFPDLSVGADDVPWVVWNGPGTDGYEIRVSHWTGAMWSPPDTLREGASRYDSYDIEAVDSNDVWFATSTYADSARGRDILVYRWDGQSWGEPWSLGWSDARDSSPDVALDPGDDPWIVWTVDHGLKEIVCSMWVDSSWSGPEVVNADSGNIGAPQMGFVDGSPLVAWVGNGDVGTGTDVEYSRRLGGEWLPAGLVNRPDGADDFDASPAIAVAQQEEAWIAWSAGNTYEYFSPEIVLARWGGESWNSEDPVTDGSANKRNQYPGAAVGSDGTPWIAWVCYEEVAPPWDTDIRATFCTDATAVQFGPLRVEPRAGEGVVDISWQASGEARDGPFQVWRSEFILGDSLDLSAPPESARELNELAIVEPPYAWLDDDVILGQGYCYWVEWEREADSVYLGPGLAFVASVPVLGPARMLSVRPNPSRCSVCLGYEQRVAGTVGIAIYDVAGRRVAQIVAPHRTPGRYSDGSALLCWNGTDSRGHRVGSGMYVGQLVFDGDPVRGQLTRFTIVR